MSRVHTKRFRKAPHSESGMSLIETMIALGLLLVVSVGVLSLGAIAMATTENEGHLQARTAEYAQDKMEQLLALKYCDKDSNTAVLPASSVGGTGLAGCPVPLVNPATGTGGVGGSSDPNAPVVGYVDYLDNTGNLLASNGAAPAGWKYIRVWQVSFANAASVTIKRVTVTVKVSSAVGGNPNLLPQSTVTALKAYPF